MGFLSRRKKGYEGAFNVERYRAAAEDLRDNSPELFSQILQGADGSEAEVAAKRDPVAYVALFLSSAEEVGIIGADV